MSHRDDPKSGEESGNPFAQHRRRFRVLSRGAAKRLCVLFLLIGLALLHLYYACIVMPGRSFDGPLPALTQSQRDLAALWTTSGWRAWLKAWSM